MSIKSDYTIQIGMSRRFDEFTDFLNPSFWLGRGRFAPTPGTQVAGKQIPRGLSTQFSLPRGIRT